MLTGNEQSQFDRDTNAVRLSQGRNRPRLIVVGVSNGQDEPPGSEEEVLPRHHQNPVFEAELSSEVDHGEEAVEFEVSEADLTDLFSCPHVDSIGASEDEREETNSMLDEFHAWDAIKSHYKSVSYDILPSCFSISEEGKLGKVPVPDLFTAKKPQSHPKDRLGVIKWL